MIAWKLETGDPGQASVRYRALIPALQFEKQFGVKSHFYHSGQRVNFRHPYRVLIFVKAFSQHDYAIALEARRRNVLVVLDVCDNIFDGDRPNAARFAEMAKLAHRVVVTTSQLKQLVESRFELSGKVDVIGDSFETQSSIDYAIEKMGEQKRWYYTAQGPLWLAQEAGRLLMRRLRNPFPKKTSSSREVSEPHLSDKPIVLWFGRSGVPGEWGMTDILIAKDALKSLYRRMPFQLVVQSDQKKIFDEAIAPLPLETHFVPWTLRNSHALLKKAKVVIVPNPLSGFTVHKSPNRTIQALAAGVPVVASKTDALLPFSDCIIFDDFEKGIESYLTDDALRAKHLELAEEHLRDYRQPAMTERLFLVIGAGEFR